MASANRSKAATQETDRSEKHALSAFEHGKLCADHDRLGTRLHAIREAIARGQRPAVEFGKFKNQLERHMRVEEDILFPAFCEARLMPDPDMVGDLLVEHGEIRRLLEAIRYDLKHQLPPTPLLDALAALLESHEATEEIFLFPILSHVGDPSVAAKLLSHLDPGRLQRPPAAG